MKAFKISANGTPLGVFTAETVEDALEAYANDAGYESYEALKEEHGEPNVTEVPPQRGVIMATSGRSKSSTWPDGRRSKPMLTPSGQKLPKFALNDGYMFFEDTQLKMTLRV